jgi:hypothetical protein
VITGFIVARNIGKKYIHVRDRIQFPHLTGVGLGRGALFVIKQKHEK